MTSFSTFGKSRFSGLLELLPIAILISVIFSAMLALVSYYQMPTILSSCFSIIILFFLWWLVDGPIARFRIKRLTRQLEKTPDDIALLRRRSRLYFKQTTPDSYALAMDDLEHILRLNPRDADALEECSSRYLMVDKYSLAAEMAERFLEVTGETEESLELYYMMLYWNYDDLGQPEKMIALLENDLLQRPRYAKLILYELIHVYEALEQGSKEKETYQRYQAAGGELTSYDRDRLRELKGK